MRPICSILSILLFTTSIGLGQISDSTENEIAVVYFIEMAGRPRLYDSVTLYDGKEPIGALTRTDYIRYECPPGEHLFYSLSDENKSFVEATLLAGKVYLIEVHIRIGGLSYIPSWGPLTNKAHMKPVNPTQKLIDIEEYRKIVDKKRSKEFYSSSKRMNEIFLKSAEKNKLGKYQRRLNRYYKKKENEKIKVLYPHWYIESETILLEPVENSIEETSKQCLANDINQFSH